jgi:hypothetical protein
MPNVVHNWATIALLSPGTTTQTQTVTLTGFARRTTAGGDAPHGAVTFTVTAIEIADYTDPRIHGEKVRRLMRNYREAEKQAQQTRRRLCESGLPA